MTGDEHTDSLQTQLLQLAAEVDALRGQINGAYTERNRCVALAARMALQLGHRAGIGKPDDATEEWAEVVYIDLPTGQVSWHFHASERPLFDGLHSYPGQWDKHDTAEKYRRVDAAFPATPCLQPRQWPADPCPQCVPGGTCNTFACGRRRSSALMEMHGVPGFARNRAEAAAQAAPATAPVVPAALPSVDEFAQHIRWLNGNNKMGAGRLAEELLSWLQTRTAAPAAPVVPQSAEPMSERDHWDYSAWQKRLGELADAYYETGRTAQAHREVRADLMLHAAMCATGWRGRSAAAPVVPQGWRLVPEEQTEEMLYAAWSHAAGDADYKALRKAWTAALAAAPQPPAAPAQAGPIPGVTTDAELAGLEAAADAAGLSVEWYELRLELQHLRTARQAVARALLLSPGDTEAAVAAVAQALCLPVEAVREVVEREDAPA